MRRGRTRSAFKRVLIDRQDGVRRRIALHNMTLHCTALYCKLHCVALRCIALQCIPLRYRKDDARVVEALLPRVDPHAWCMTFQVSMTLLHHMTCTRKLLRPRFQPPQAAAQ